MSRSRRANFTAAEKVAILREALLERQPGSEVSYLSICGTFYYLCSILDGFSRAIVHWDIAESMREAGVEMIIQRGLERFPGSKPTTARSSWPRTSRHSSGWWV